MAYKPGDLDVSRFRQIIWDLQREDKVHVSRYELAYLDWYISSNNPVVDSHSKWVIKENYYKMI